MTREEQEGLSIGGSGTVADLFAPAGPGTAPSVSPTTEEGEPTQRRQARMGKIHEGPLPRYVLGLVGAITLAGLLLRLPSFYNSLADDEISTYFIVVGTSLSRVLRLVHSNQETSPPLYFIVAWLTKGLLGSPVQSIRLVSLATGTAAIPLTFLLGLWTVGRRAALVGAACVALSPYMIFYSTEARPYMLVLFFALMSALALLRAIDTGRWGWWAGYAVCSSAGIYSHYTVVFPLVAQLAWALWTQPKARRALVLSNVAVVIAFLPWLGGLREDLHAPNFISEINPVRLSTLKAILGNFWIGHPITPIHSLPGDLSVVLALMGLGLGLVGIAVAARGRSWVQWRPLDRTVLIAVLAFGPTLLVLLYSVTRGDLLGGRYLIASWPALALVIGAVVTIPPRPLKAAAVTLTIIAFGIGGLKMLSPSAQRPDLNAAVAFIDRSGSSDDPIVSEPLFANPLSEVDTALADVPSSGRHPVIRLGVPALAEQLSHLAGPHPLPVFIGLPVTPPQEVAHQAVMLAHHDTLFLVISLFDLGKASSLSSAALLRTFTNVPVSEFIHALPAGYRVVNRRVFPGFSGAEPVLVYEFHDGTVGT